MLFGSTLPASYCRLYLPLCEMARRRADADRAYVKNLTKSCKKAIVEAFTNCPSLAAVMKGIENCVIDIAVQNTFFALDQI